MMTTTAVSTLAPVLAAAGDDTLRVTQASVVRAESIKFRSVRSHLVTLGSAAVVLVALGMLFSSLTGRDRATGPQTGNDALSLSLAGMHLSQLFIAVVAAVFVAGEYATGMIRTMFGAVAARTPVLWAKSLVLGGVTWVVMTVASFAAFAAGQALYAGDGVTYSLSDSGVLRAVLGTGFYAAGIAVIGVAVGFLLRSTAAAIGVLVGVLMLAPVLVGLLPDSIGDPISKVLPSNAGQAFRSITSADGIFSPLVGFVVFLAWVVGLLGLAAVTLRHRDA